jgi:hypothetical protein
MGHFLFMVLMAMGAALLFGVGLIPDADEVTWLKMVTNNTAPLNVILKLYKNNYTPVAGSTEASFTEATFTGYSSIELAGASWGFTQASPSHADYAQQTFTSSADQTAQTIYGYYLVQKTSGYIMGAEAFASPFTIANNGDTIKVTPVLYLREATE